MPSHESQIQFVNKHKYPLFDPDNFSSSFKTEAFDSIGDLKMTWEQNKHNEHPIAAFSFLLLSFFFLTSWFCGHCWSKIPLCHQQYHSPAGWFLPQLLCSCYPYKFFLTTYNQEAKNFYSLRWYYKLLSSETTSWAQNLSGCETSFECLSNHQMLPVWGGTREPDICSISSSKLQSWINTINYITQTVT